MANKRGKVELKVYKADYAKMDPQDFTRKFIIDGIECYGIYYGG